MSTYLLPAALCVGLSIFVVVLGMCLVAMCLAALDDWQGDLGSDEPDAHAQIADDVHLAKVALIADAMKADREEAFAKYLKAPVDAVPRINGGA